jgi:hypothetical protein
MYSSLYIYTHMRLHLGATHTYNKFIMPFANHFQYANVDSEKTGDEKDKDQYLTELGRRQAHQTGERLAAWTHDDKGRPITYTGIHTRWLVVPLVRNVPFMSHPL